MTPLRMSPWRKLPLSLTELCLDTTLRSGQSFRWQKINNEWNSVLHGRLLSLKQDEKFLHYRVAWPQSGQGPYQSLPLSVDRDEKSSLPEDDTEALLKHYFSLKYDMTAMCDQWAASDAHFREKVPKFPGIRILSQDPWETLVSFMCSKKSSIPRIREKIHKICVHYGPLIGHIGDKAFHDFPSPGALDGPDVEAHLRKLGIGSPAKYVPEAAVAVSTVRSEGWLESLANPENPPWRAGLVPGTKKSITYKEAREELLINPGVGDKVADRVCLMGLGWSEAVPVDPEVWRIAQRDYRFRKTTKMFSSTVYNAVGDHFRQIWGPRAGWAQSVLFTANPQSLSGQAAVETKPVEVAVEAKQEIATETETPSRTRKRPTTRKARS